jgi:hypothetical protein
MANLRVMPLHSLAQLLLSEMFLGTCMHARC